MFTPKKSKLTNQRTLNSFFPTLEAANTDDTLQAVDTDNQDSNPAQKNVKEKHCSFRLRKTREEMVNIALGEVGVGGGGGEKNIFLASF